MSADTTSSLRERSRVIVKIGTSSLTDDNGVISHSMIASVCRQIAGLRELGHEVVLVSSGAVAAGVAALQLPARPSDVQTLQALAAVGQSRLMEVYNVEFHAVGLIAAQVLLVPNDFVDRQQYLHARATLERLLELGVVPVVNENDTIAADEIRFGDNDRIAALLSHLLRADVLVLLTDIDGLYTADPRRDPAATLVAEVAAGDPLLSVSAGLTGTRRGSGGMAAKMAAARSASASGVRTVIARSTIDDVFRRAGDRHDLVGTTFLGSDRHYSARQLWLAHASEVLGSVVIDAGAERALVDGNGSLLPAGVVDVVGDFDETDTIEVVNQVGRVVARGAATMSSVQARASRGRRTSDLDESSPRVVVHRDDMVVFG
ncbi:MAG: glutamate 5-kinase [Ilumatobacteraceae bacterium]